MNKPNCKFSIKEKYEEITNLILYGIGWPSEQSPVKRKEFDITKYKFSDGDMDVLIEGEGRVLINVDPDRSIFAELSTEDIIALAKHKKLTAGDLK